MTQEILGTGGWGEVKVGIFRGTKVAVKCLFRVILYEYNEDCCKVIETSGNFSLSFKINLFEIKLF